VTESSICHWTDVLVRLAKQLVSEHYFVGAHPNRADLRAQMASAVGSIAAAERDGIDANVLRFGILRQLLIDHGCAWPEGGHRPTFVSAWLESLGATFQRAKHDRPESRTV